MRTVTWDQTPTFRKGIRLPKFGVTIFMEREIRPRNTNRPRLLTGPPIDQGISPLPIKRRVSVTGHTGRRYMDGS